MIRKYFIKLRIAYQIGYALSGHSRIGAIDFILRRKSIRWRLFRRRWRRFLKANGICWQNVLAFPRYFIWVMWMWARYWRGAPWKLFPVDWSALRDKDLSI